MVVHGAMTAIKRKIPPQPLRWLYAQGLIKGRSLDYGCGQPPAPWYGMHGYDPHWRPIQPTGTFDTITNNYVLNVVPPDIQKEVILKVYRLLKPGGTAYFAVRRDLPKAGRAGRGTYQRYVILKFPSIKKTSEYEIYKLHKKG